jgi:hypothetical protein
VDDEKVRGEEAKKLVAMCPMKVFDVEDLGSMTERLLRLTEQRVLVLK